MMEASMTRFHEKAQALTKRTVGQMIGDDRLVSEGEEQEHRAEKQDAAKEDEQAAGEKRH
jgi:uncharacterized protein YjbJ (UPF0337 family)